jgi:hypothetical protein
MTTPVATEPKEKAPGFEAFLAAVGISLAGYLCRRRETEKRN